MKLISKTRKNEVYGMALRKFGEVFKEAAEGHNRNLRVQTEKGMADRFTQVPMNLRTDGHIAKMKTTYMTYQELYSSMNFQTGICVMYYSEIAENTGSTEKTIGDHIKKLSELGYIITTHQWDYKNSKQFPITFFIVPLDKVEDEEYKQNIINKIKDLDDEAKDKYNKDKSKMKATENIVDKKEEKEMRYIPSNEEDKALEELRKQEAIERIKTSNRDNKQKDKPAYQVPILPVIEKVEIDTSDVTEEDIARYMKIEESLKNEEPTEPVKTAREIEEEKKQEKERMTQENSIKLEALNFNLEEPLKKKLISNLAPILHIYGYNEDDLYELAEGIKDGKYNVIKASTEYMLILQKNEHLNIK